MHLPNSKSYLDFLKIQNFDVFYREFYDEVCFSFKQTEFLEELDGQRKMLHGYCDDVEEIVLSAYAKSSKCSVKQISDRMTVIPKYPLKSFFINLYNSEMVHEKDMNIKSFHSTVALFEDLCKISWKIGKLKENMIEELVKEITILNKKFPANVYIPFMKDSIRNYLICHMPVSQLRIFKTKNRAPFLVQFELIRIDEVILEFKKIYGKQSNFNESQYKKMNQHIQNKAKDAFNGDGEEEAEDELLSKTRSLTISKLTKSKSSRIPSATMIVNKPQIDFPLGAKKQRAQTIKMLIESDIRVSKPQLIKNVDTNKSTILKENKIILEQDFEDSVINEDISNEDMLDKVIQESIGNKFSLIKTTFSPPDQRQSVFPFVQPTNDKILESEDLAQKSYTMNERSVDMNKIKDIFNSNESKSKSHPKNSSMINRDTVKGAEISKIAKLEVENSINGDDEKPEDYSELKFTLNPLKIEIKQEDQNIFNSDEEDEILRSNSPFGEFNTWRTFKCIVKSGEDLRQEQFASQLINLFYQIFKIEKVDCYVNPYEVISTGEGCGLIECVENALSFDSLKKKMKSSNLKEFFVNYFGAKSSIGASKNSPKYKEAVFNFIKSLAGYCLICYILQIKDRHNGNILLDNEGHIVHIDFGFMFTIAPGKGIHFEKVPFKLTNEIIDILEGVSSNYFKMFRKLLWSGFVAIVKHSERIIILVEMMLLGYGDSLPCFKRKDAVLSELRDRLQPFPKKKMSNADYFKHVDSLIEQSIDNWRTKWYDKYQYYFQGIFY